MFSPLGRAAFSVPLAARSPNLLDALVHAGIEVEWRDNNSGAKGIAASPECLAAQRDRRLSHDHLYHTVLGAMGVTNARYASGMDLLAPCGG